MAGASAAMTGAGGRMVHGVGDRQRMLLMLGAGGLSALVAYAFARMLLGLAPDTPWFRETAVIVHVATAVPAIPLGAYVLLTRKGGARHKLLGRLWLVLMVVTATASLWIRNINNGDFSFIHLFVVATYANVPLAILSARKGDIVAHKKRLIGFYTGAMLLAGITSFAPGRIMWHWAFG